MFPCSIIPISAPPPQSTIIIYMLRWLTLMYIIFTKSGTKSSTTAMSWVIATVHVKCNMYTYYVITMNWTYFIGLSPNMAPLYCRAIGTDSGAENSTKANLEWRQIYVILNDSSPVNQDYKHTHTHMHTHTHSHAHLVTMNCCLPCGLCLISSHSSPASPVNQDYKHTHTHMHTHTHTHTLLQ